MKPFVQDHTATVLAAHWWVNCVSELDPSSDPLPTIAGLRAAPWASLGAHHPLDNTGLVRIPLPLLASSQLAMARNGVWK